jgi:hypothetical protein
MHQRIHELHLFYEPKYVIPYVRKLTEEYCFVFNTVYDMSTFVSHCTLKM